MTTLGWRSRVCSVLLGAVVLFIGGCGGSPASAPAREAAPSTNRASAADSGESATYTYDAAGNVLQVQTAAGTPVTVTGFSPSIGGPGQVVAVTGSGFAPDPVQNAVALHGTPCAVQSATATTLSFVVPEAATTGPITVTTAGSTATTADSFTVVHGVVISDFSPKVGKVGTPLAITGFNFDPVASGNVVRVGGGPASVGDASLTALQATVGAGASSGKISVTARGSTGTSEEDFFFVPSSYTVANVGVTRRIAPGEDAPVSLPIAGQIGLVVFDGVQGQNVSLYVSGNTFPAMITVKLFSPSGAELVPYPGAVPAGQSAKLVPPALPSTGVYTVVIQPAAGATGSLHLQVLPDVVVALQDGAVPAAMSLANGQNGRCTFTADAGDTLGFGFPALTLTPAVSVTLSLLLPNGTRVGWVIPSAPGSWQLPAITTAGTYTLLVEPGGTAAASLSLLLSRPLTGTIAADGTPKRFETVRPGQGGRYTFSATEGQSFTLRATSSAGFVNNAYMEIRKPDGNLLPSGSASFSANRDLKLSLGVLSSTGTYTVKITPAGLSVGSVDLRLIPESTGTVVVGDPALPVTLAAGQDGRYAFAANVGDTLALGVPTLSTTPATSVTLLLLLPNGSPWSQTTLYGPGSWQLPAITTAGTYTLVVQPGGTAAASLSLLLSRPLTGTIAADGTPKRFETARPGQGGRYTFSATAGLSFTLRRTSSPGFVSGGTIEIKKPDGNQLAYTGLSGNTDSKINLKVLPATGTYTVLVTPAGISVGTLDLRLIPYATGTLAVGDPPTTLSLIAGQNGRYSIAASSGDLLNMVTSSYSTTPAGRAANYTVFKPDGSALSAGMIYGIGTLQWPQLPATGTYLLEIEPANGTAATFALQLVRR